MFDWILDNLPIFVSVDCTQSKSLDAVILSPLTATALIKMTSGNVYAMPVRRFDMLRLCNRSTNVGQWLNTYAIV